MRWLALLLALGVLPAQAQTWEQRLHVEDITPIFSEEDQAVIREALLKTQAAVAAYNDISAVERLKEVTSQIAHIDGRSLPMVGFALSRNSQDPKACALLQRIEPSAVCMK